MAAPSQSPSKSPPPPQPGLAIDQAPRVAARPAPMLATAGRGVVVKGRNGETLSRTRHAGMDPFNIPPEVVPKGWEYQWNVISVNGSGDVARRHNLTMWSQGWRPVPAKRHEGMFTPHGFDGDIVVEGQRLEERPVELCEEARDADYREAYGQMRNRDEQLMGRKANLAGSMGNGIELRTDVRSNRGRQTRLSIDDAYDIPQPAHQPADDSVP